MFTFFLSKILMTFFLVIALFTSLLHPFTPFYAYPHMLFYTFLLFALCSRNNKYSVKHLFLLNSFITAHFVHHCTLKQVLAISRLEKVIISKLCVVSDFDAKIVKGSRANRPTSIVWRYFGVLQQSTAERKPSIWTTIV